MRAIILLPANADNFIKTILVSFFTLLIFITLGSAEANACWCRIDPEETSTEERYRQTITQDVDNSEFVFAGKVIREDNAHITFKIADMWKGDANNEITFYYRHNVTDDSEQKFFINDCEYLFQMDKSYLVYANVGNSGLSVSKCGRTSLFAAAIRDIAELNRRQRKAIFAKFDYKLLSPLVLHKVNLKKVSL